MRKLLFLFLFLPLLSTAQDAEEGDSLKLPDFTGLRIYKSLNTALQNKDSVYRLDISKLKLKELPEDIRQLKHLRELNVSKNNISVIPEWISELKELEVFDASSNKLVTLPVTIGQLTKLTKLSLNRNLIETLPAEMGMLANLQVLEMWDNELEAVPVEMKNLHHLKIFELRGILFTHEEQLQIQDLLPDTRIYFSPPCNCAK